MLQVFLPELTLIAGAKSTKAKNRIKITTATVVLPCLARSMVGYLPNMVRPPTYYKTWYNTHLTINNNSLKSLLAFNMNAALVLNNKSIFF